MITKSKGVVKVTSQAAYLADYQLQQDGSWASYNANSWSDTLVNGSTETITYDNAKRVGKFKRTRFCDHNVVSVMERSNRADSYLNEAKTRRREAFAQSSSFESMYSQPLPLPNLASVHSEALQYFSSGCVNREFSLLNDMLEIGDTFSLLKGPLALTRPDTWRKLQSKLRNNTGVLRKRTETLSQKVVRDLKGIANVHLGYQFGVKPLIADIKATARILTSFEEKVRWLRKNSNKPVRVSFKKDLSRNYAPSSTYEDYGYTYGGTRIDGYKCFYHAWAVLTYDVSRLSDFELSQAVLRRQLGVDSLLAVAWEAVPYSFIVDWFVKIGDLLAKIGNLELPYSIQDMGYSVKIEETRTTWYAYRWPRSVTHTVPGSLYRRRFYRACGLPASLSVSSASPLGLQQLALAASLFVQRLK